MRKELNAIDWKQTFGAKSVDASYKSFLKIYYKLCDKWIPKNTKRAHGRQRAPWLTQEVASLTKLKASLWNRNQASKWKITSLVKEYQLVRNKVKKACIVARGTFENSVSHEKKNQKSYSHISITSYRKPLESSL